MSTPNVIPMPDRLQAPSSSRERQAHLRDLELSVLAQQIAKLLTQAWLVQHDDVAAVPEDVKARMTTIAERAIRSTSETALLLASAAANCAFRDRIGRAMAWTLQSGRTERHSLLHQMDHELQRGGADEIIAAYERELSR